MKTVFAVLAVAVLAGPVLAVFGNPEYFQVTGDGSFTLYRSSSGPEMGNNGAGGAARISKSNQDMGWMSFYGAVGDNGSASIADYVNTQAGGNWTWVRAKLHFRTDGAGDATSKIAVVSIRSGNTGGLVEDGNSGSMSLGNVGTGFTGSSQTVAFRACAPTNGSGFANLGDGLYPYADPQEAGPGVPWIAPADRKPAGRNGFIFGPGDMIRYDIDGDGTNADTGLYDGFNQDGAQGANYWAVEDLLGLRQNNGMASGGAQQIYDAGQILVGGQAAPTLFNPKDAAYNGTDPRRGTTDPNWKEIALDPAFLQDLATNPQNKGLAFTSRISGLGVDDWSNFSYYTKDQAGGTWAPYLELYSIPEPATLCLLTVGGLALLRRRNV